MATPTRFTYGVGTEKITHPLGQFPLPNPHNIYLYQNDFSTYAAGDWTVTAGGAGSGVAVAAGIGGQIAITTATSGVESIVGETLGFNFTNFTSAANGLKTWFRARVTLDAAVTNPDYQIGLCTASATFNGNTDGVYFTKASGATVWSFVLKAASTATTVALPTTTLPVNSATIDLAYYFDGRGLFWIYFNDVLIGTYGTANNGTLGSLGSSLANLPASTTGLGVTFLNGFHTATSVLTVDYVLAGVEIVR
jgi:hypothetical protein